MPRPLHRDTPPLQQKTVSLTSRQPSARADEQIAEWSEIFLPVELRSVVFTFEGLMLFVLYVTCMCSVPCAGSVIVRAYPYVSQG